MLIHFTWSGRDDADAEVEQAFSDDGGRDLGGQLGNGVHACSRVGGAAGPRTFPRRGALGRRREVTCISVDPFVIILIIIILILTF